LLLKQLSISCNDKEPLDVSFSRNANNNLVQIILRSLITLSMSMAAVVGALSDIKPASAKYLESHLPPAGKLELLHNTVAKCQPSTLRNISRHATVFSC